MDESSDRSHFITPPPGLIPPGLVPPRQASLADAPSTTDSATHRIDAARAPSAPPTPFFAAPIGAPPKAPAEAPVDAAADAAASAHPVVLIFADGARHGLEHTTLLGRNPAVTDSWPSGLLLPVDDPAKTVSKTHAAIEVVGQMYRLHDLNSTNGVRLVRDGSEPLVVVSGQPAELRRGDTVLLGDYRIGLG